MTAVVLVQMWTGSISTLCVSQRKHCEFPFCLLYMLFFNKIKSTEDTQHTPWDTRTGEKELLRDAAATQTVLNNYDMTKRI